jgi:ATP-dependent DNA helicase RecQ
VEQAPLFKPLLLPWQGEAGPPRDYEVVAKPGPVASVKDESLRFFLKLLFGRDSFLPGQAEGVRLVLEGRDSIVLLPTGGGKSLVFQLAAMLMPGTCLVIEPTRSLMEDQVRHLRDSGLRRALSITGEASDLGERAAKLRLLAAGWAHFCYVAPERLRTAAFRRCLRSARLCLIAVDEAHCVSEWGHDFRTSYLHAADAARRFSERAPLAALTGTASPETLEDVKRLLRLREPGLVAPFSPDRPELSFRVLRCTDKERPAALERLVQGMRDRCGIVFCPHVEGRFGVRAAGRALGAEVYHGKPPRGMGDEEWGELKRRAAERFGKSEARVLAATKAFGLGIDKADVRWTVHAGLPSSLEAFFQEAGRAGRDRAPATCWLLASIEDAPRALWLLDPSTPLREVLGELRRTRPSDEDDVIRALRLHVHAFRGPERELDDVEQALLRLRPLKAGERRIAFPCQHQPLAEKALHRLERVGVVSDYLIRYAEEAFDVRLSGEPLDRERLRADIRRTYDTVEPERRRSLRELVLCCMPGVGEEEFRARIVEYLDPRSQAALGQNPSAACPLGPPGALDGRV